MATKTEGLVNYSTLHHLSDTVEAVQWHGYVGLAKELGHWWG